MIRGLPSENYVVVALDQFEPGTESDPEQLQQRRALGTSV
jgi:hypothetical protein